MASLVRLAGRDHLIYALIAIDDVGAWLRLGLLVMLGMRHGTALRMHVLHRRVVGAMIPTITVPNKKRIICQTCVI